MTVELPEVLLNLAEVGEELSCRSGELLIPVPLTDLIEDIDVAETIIQFTAAQNALQAALGAIGKTSNMTLLNYL